MKEKRYVVTVDMYVYGNDDYTARKQAHKMIDILDYNYPNARPSINELGEQPFATMDYRKLDDHSKPISQQKKVKPLPF
jgi:hypothetical protein